MEKHYLVASVWFRESGKEWVLELSGAINDMDFTCRHTEPATTKPEDVAGLPSLYAENDKLRELCGELADALQGYVSLDGKDFSDDFTTAGQLALAKFEQLKQEGKL